MRPLETRLRALADTSEQLAATTKYADVRQALSSFSERSRRKAEAIDLLNAS
jgi:hypothetical protein